MSTSSRVASAEYHTKRTAVILKLGNRDGVGYVSSKLSPKAGSRMWPGIRSSERQNVTSVSRENCTQSAWREPPRRLKMRCC